MKVPFYVKKIIAHNDFLSDTEVFTVYLMDGRKTVINFALEAIGTMSPAAFENALYFQIESAVKAEAKEINIEKEDDYLTYNWSSPKLDDTSKAAIESKSVPFPYAAPLGDTVLKTMEKLLPDIKKIVACPACEALDTLQRMIMHLNDDHKWKREAQADWVESLDLDLEFKTKGV